MQVICHKFASKTKYSTTQDIIVVESMMMVIFPHNYIESGSDAIVIKANLYFKYFLEQTCKT